MWALQWVGLAQYTACSYIQMKNQEEIDKKFLYGENKRLRLQLKQSKELLKIHKEAVQRLSQPHVHDRAVIQILLDLIVASQHSEKIDKLNQKILGLESQQMVLEKIVEQTDNDEKETYHLLAEEYNKIKQDNEGLEKQLHKFYQKIGEVDYLSGLVTKFKEVISPTEQAAAFKKEQQQLLQFICMQKQSIRKLTEQKNKLLKINILMKESVEQQKDEVRNMTMILNSPDMLMNISMARGGQAMSPGLAPTSNILDELNLEQQNGKAPGSTANMSLMNGTNTSVLNTSSARGLNTTMNFIKMQRKIIKEQEEEQIGDSNQESEGEYECPELNILFPDKVQKIKKDKQITKVPYLNMMKIREIMAKRDTKLRKEIQAEGRHINPTDKIIKLETQLDITRKQLTSQTLKFRNMSQQLKSALKLTEQLQYRNQLLINSNQRLQNNYKHMYKDYQFTKIIALRVEKAMRGHESSQHFMEELNTTTDYEEKIRSAETLLKRVLGKKVMPSRSKSLDQ